MSLFKFCTCRFQPDKGFSGTESAQTRDGPVQFEKETEEDPFGLNQLFTEAKRAKRPSEGSRLVLNLNVYNYILNDISFYVVHYAQVLPTMSCSVFLRINVCNGWVFEALVVYIMSTTMLTCREAGPSKPKKPKY